MAGITLQDITKSFGATQVLRGIALEMAHGAFVSLVGPSGCGKTTLLRIIAGLETADAGTVSIGGRDVGQLRAADRDIAMVFQNYALYPHMTAGQNIAVPLVMRRLSALQRTPLLRHLVPGTAACRAAIAAEVADAANLLAIGHLLDRRPAQLSGGQRQRVALGRAIVRHPAAFLMDEPLSNLDAALRQETRTELVELHRRVGVTTVYVTHDQAEAMTMSDRVAVMHAGQVLQYDTPRAIYEEPADLRVASFIGSPRINVIEAEVDPAGVLSLAGAPLGAAIRPGPAMVRLGIRPDHLVPMAGGLACAVRHIEFLGAEVLVHLRPDHAASDLVARFTPEFWAAQRGAARLSVGAAPHRLLAFGADGRRLALRLLRQPEALRA
jgi:multiple sugar transport system ATP-binding protein